MAVSRVLIRQGEKQFRFLKFVSAPDGSLVVSFARGPRQIEDRMSPGSDGSRIPAGSELVTSSKGVKFTVHTTGTVHKYFGGRAAGRSFIEPLYQLGVVRTIGFISVPHLSRLDEISPSEQGVTHFPLEFPEEIDERLTFLLQIGPRASRTEHFGLRLDYEVYSAFISLVQSPEDLPSELDDHFVFALHSGNEVGSKVGKAEAEIAFHQAAQGNVSPLFRGKDGSYILMATVPMRIAPSLEVEFDRNDLRIEQVPFISSPQPSHKVKFWICNKGGRNKTDDLRRHVVGLALDAEI